MKVTAKVDYQNELIEGVEYELIAVIQTEHSISGWVVVISDNEHHDFGTYDAKFFFEPLDF